MQVSYVDFFQPTFSIFNWDLSVSNLTLKYQIQELNERVDFCIARNSLYLQVTFSH